MTADEQLGLLYLPISGPASNYYGGDRPGDNLFGNSIVAIDGNTGAYKWHFQLVHHDIWDFDNPPAPALLEITRDGQRIPALAQIGKSGWMFILDRRNGKPIFGVDERPVAKGDVPGEWYAPTQPFPRKPRELARMSFSYEDLVTADDTTPAHAANCRALYEKSGGFYNVGPFTPFLYHEEGTPPRSSIIFPGATGGTNWGGMATDQQRGYVFVYTQNQGQIGWVEKKKPGVNYAFDEAQSNLPYTRASVNGPGPFFTFSASAGEGLGNYPCQRPPWGQLNAVDANTGDILWQVPVGSPSVCPRASRTPGSPAVSRGRRPRPAACVFYGALSDRRLRAFDSMTGKELWSVDLGATATMQPMSYLGSDRRQYVAVVAGGVRSRRSRCRAELLLFPIERTVPLLEGLVEPIRQAAIGADVAALDQPLAADLDQLGVFTALFGHRRRLPDPGVRDASPDDVSHGPVPSHFDYRVGQHHVVLRAWRGICLPGGASSIQLGDFVTAMGDRAVDVEHRILGEVIGEFVRFALREVVVVAREQILDLDTVEQRLHRDLLRPRGHGQRRQQQEGRTDGLHPHW